MNTLQYLNMITPQKVSVFSLIKHYILKGILVDFGRFQFNISELTDCDLWDGVSLIV